MRSDGLRLSDRLDSYQLKLLDAAAHNGDITLAALDSMQPWLASEFLTVAAATNAGLSPELSADEALKSRAKREQKNVIYLETIEDQIRVSADQGEALQMLLLTETLEGFDTLGKELTIMEGSGTGFAAVGTSHLLGEDSLIEMLREQGYTVARYYAFQGENVINPINPTIERPVEE